MEPTEEQAEALAAFGKGESLVIEALAGTGKTTTLVMIAKSRPDLRMQYTAFNKAIVADIGAELPENAQANTAHSLAFRNVGKTYAHRLRGGRMRGFQMAKLLRIDPIFLNVEGGKKVLQPDYLASLVMRSIEIYCQSDDALPERKHIPYIEGIDLPTADLGRTYRNNDIVRDELAPALRIAWRDIIDPDGGLPFRHSHYLKIWEQSDPHIGADVILWDECQDVSPVLESVIRQQEHAQVVMVGDPNQAIYGFTGARDAIARSAITNRAALTQSFRFGPEIADAANLVLAMLTPLRLRGLDSLASVVARLDEDQIPNAILTRTNATAVRSVLTHQAAGRKVHLVGGGDDIASFARAAQQLMERTPTRHPELACFSSWGEVQEYVRNDPQGDELRLLVKLVDEFGVDTILQALDSGVREDQAEVVVSTSHKAKGRAWPVVQMAGDFPEEIEGEEEWRLVYVAATRARMQLDLSACAPLAEMHNETKDEVTT